MVKEAEGSFFALVLIGTSFPKHGSVSSMSATKKPSKLLDQS